MNFILLRGLIRHSDHWGKFKTLFQQAFPESTILTPDLPGLGHESTEKTPLTIEENVEFLSNKLAPVLQDGEWVVIGLSLGGMVAAKWCELHPKTFSHVVLMNPSSKLSPFWHRLNPRALPVFLRCFMTTDDALREKRILGLTSNLRHKDQPLIQSWINIAAKSPINRSTFLRQLLAARAFKIKKCAAPCLVLNSENDHIVNPACSSRIANFLGARLKTHHQAGHDLAIDAPEWTLKKIRLFLSEM
ncbi:MAG: alpha/beta hydrolase [Pseudomonadales bacterium]|nr:alpha/beta hydrolase [Pseudomonadales bacterium]